MNRSLRVFTASFAMLLSVAAIGVDSNRASAKPSPAVDAEAVKLLRGMAEHLGGLKQFSLTALNMREDVLDSGHRVDFEATTKVTVGRPNKLQGVLVSNITDQTFYYDGKTLTLHNPTDKVYATVPAPKTIEETLDFARETLGLGFPVSDLVYPNSFALLMQDVTVAVNVGKEMIGGVRCDHLLFSRPGVDFQIWIADSGKPLPIKYVVTDTSTPELLSITTRISDWNTAPDAADSQFNFAAPSGAREITFLPLKQ